MLKTRIITSERRGARLVKGVDRKPPLLWFLVVNTIMKQLQAAVRTFCADLRGSHCHNSPIKIDRKSYKPRNNSDIGDNWHGRSEQHYK